MAAWLAIEDPQSHWLAQTGCRNPMSWLAARNRADKEPALERNSPRTDVVEELSATSVSCFLQHPLNPLVVSVSRGDRQLPNKSGGPTRPGSLMDRVPLGG